MNLFGTDGIRTKIGNDPLSTDCLIDLAKAISQWMIFKKKEPKIIIAHDTRISSPFIKSYLISGLIQNNIEIFDAEILPTPAIYNLVQKQKLFDFGIVITASHNLYHDNGIKIIDAENDKLAKEDEELISLFFKKKQFQPTDYENLGTLNNFNQAQELYCNYISKFFEKNFLKNTKIGLDCANGALYKIAPAVFKSFGANIISINDSPNGKNINENCGSTKPENLQNFVLEKNCDIVFAFDGDGDRLTIINKNGEIKDGDDILAFLSNHHIYQANKLVGTIISNYGLEFHLKNKNKKLIRTPVGDKFVAQQLIKDNLLLGGEQSGHIILRDYLNSSDGIFTALRILQQIKLTNDWNITTFEKFPQYCQNLKIVEKQDLNKEPYATIISNYQKQIDGKLIVRYSGTESVLRIMVECHSLILAKTTAQNLIQELNNAFKQDIKDISYGSKKSISQNI